MSGGAKGNGKKARGGGGADLPANDPKKENGRVCVAPFYEALKNGAGRGNPG